MWRCGDLPATTDGCVCGGGGVAHAVSVYAGRTPRQKFCSGSNAKGNVPFLELLLSWRKPDNKQRMEIHFDKNNDKGYTNGHVTDGRDGAEERSKEERAELRSE